MHIVVFFTFDISLKNWHELGILNREVLLYKKLTEKKHKVTFITFGNTEDLNILNNSKIKVVPVYKYVKYSKNKFIRYFKSFLIPFYLLNKIDNIDLIKTNQLMGAWVAIVMKIIKRKPLYIRTGYDAYQFSIQNKKSLIKRLFYFLLTYFSVFFSDVYSVTSKKDQDFIYKKYPLINKNKIVVNQNWVNVEPEIKKISDRHKDKILTVGRLEPQKNYKYLINEFKNSNLVLDIVGEGSLSKELKKTATEENLNIVFHSNIEHSALLEMYQDYKIFVLASTFEGNPKALLEAMGRGCVIFANDIESNTEIIKNKYNGILFDPKKIDLKTELNNLLLNEKLLNEISQNGHKYIQDNNSLEIAIENESKILDRFDFS